MLVFLPLFPAGKACIPQNMDARTEKLKTSNFEKRSKFDVLQHLSLSANVISLGTAQGTSIHFFSRPLRNP